MSEWIGSHQILLGAIISAIAALVTSGILVFLLEKSKARLGFEKDSTLLREKDALDRELLKVKDEHEREMLKIKGMHERALIKFKSGHEEKMRLRAERQKFIEELRGQLEDAAEEFTRGIDFTMRAESTGAKVGEEEAVERAQRVFAAYAELRESLKKAKGMIRRTHLFQLQRFKSLLVRVQLDMALFPNESASDKRLGRLEAYKKALQEFMSKADELFRQISAFDLRESDKTAVVGIAPSK